MPCPPPDLAPFCGSSGCCVNRDSRQKKGKPPFGGFPGFEDAKVGLLVSFFWLFSRYVVFQPRVCIQARICSCIGLPGIALPIHSEFLRDVPVAPPVGLRFSLLLQVLPLASTAPNTGGGSDLHSQGGCQQANLLALRLSPQLPIYACSPETQNVFSATIGCSITNSRFTRYIAPLSSSNFGSANREDLSKAAQIRGRRRNVSSHAERAAALATDRIINRLLASHAIVAALK